jgi:hypothetical protein
MGGRRGSNLNVGMSVYTRSAIILTIMMLVHQQSDIAFPRQVFGLSDGLHGAQMGGLGDD